MKSGFLFFVFKSGHHGHPSSHHPAMAAAVAAAGLHPDTDTDPRELEAFAERFKQRRIKLGNYYLRTIKRVQFFSRNFSKNAFDGIVSR